MSLNKNAKMWQPSFDVLIAPTSHDEVALAAMFGAFGTCTIIVVRDAAGIHQGRAVVSYASVRDAGAAVDLHRGHPSGLGGFNVGRALLTAEGPLTVLVGQLRFDVTAEQLRAVFGVFGKVVHVFVFDRACLGRGRRTGIGAARASAPPR
jgi:hypothetical protein